MLGIRSSPCFSHIKFEIHYLCKQELCGKSLVRVYTSICALDQVIENWSHLCKLYNNQEEYGSVTPGCRKETSPVIRHKAGLLLQNWEVGSGGGDWGDALSVAGPREKKTPMHNDSISKPLSHINQGSSRSPKYILRQQFILYQLTRDK